VGKNLRSRISPAECADLRDADEGEFLPVLPKNSSFTAATDRAKMG
jgi:hypothetical protein